MVTEKSIEKTVKNKKLKGSKRIHIEGAIRKCFNDNLDESIPDWIHERHSKGLWVSRKFFMKKASQMMNVRQVLAN